LDGIFSVVALASSKPSNLTQYIDVRDALASFTSLPEEGQARLRAGMSREKQASVLEAWHSSGRAEGT
jgi:hypothetical protein